MRTRREITADIRRMRRIVKNASIGDDGPGFVEKRLVLNQLEDELADFDAPAPVLRALPPASEGTFIMRRTARTRGGRAGETEEEKQLRLRRARIDARSGARANIHNPEAAAHQEAQARKGKLHIKGLIPKSAMHQAR